MITLRELIYTSFREAKITESGEYETNPELESEAISALQNILSSWSTQNLLMPFTVQESFSFEPDKDQYSIGPLADFDTQNPDKIVNMYIEKEINKSYYLDEISQEEYFRIHDKQLSSQNGPTKYYFNFQHPASFLYIWPVPSITIKVVFSSYKPYEWISIDNLEDPLNAPTPYIDAMISHLTIKMCNEHGTDIPPGTVSSASQSLINLTKMSQKTVSKLQYDNLFKFMGSNSSWI